MLRRIHPSQYPPGQYRWPISTERYPGAGTSLVFIDREVQDTQSTADPKVRRQAAVFQSARASPCPLHLILAPEWDEKSLEAETLR